ncbi:hypothetical protein [Nitrosopumilus sp.]|uniref:hypothetical protein n=1 Tax=Nitrosopumilus sp. TaxID=2024843 RepID=UPI003D0BB54D
MKQDIKCSNCGFVVHGDDPEYYHVKEKHMKRYQEHTIVSERDGRVIVPNNTKIKPHWITIW